MGNQATKSTNRSVIDSLTRDPGIAPQFDLQPPATSQDLVQELSYVLLEDIWSHHRFLLPASSPGVKLPSSRLFSN